MLENGVRPSGSELGDLLLLCGPTEAGASRRGVEIAELLLKTCTAPSAEEGFLAEHVFEAAKNGWDGLLEVLLKFSIGWKVFTGSSQCGRVNGRTAISAACAARHIECIMALLNAGADASIADEEAVTPLMQSCTRNHCAAVAALLAAGVDALSSGGLRVCCELGRPEILAMLLASATRSAGRETVRQALAQPLLVAIDNNHAACARVRSLMD